MSVRFREIMTALSLSAALLPGGAGAQTAVQDSVSTASKHSRFPFMAAEARKRGHTLPLPYGLSVVLTGLGNRKIEVTDVRLGVKANPAQSVSDFLDLGSSSDVFNANLKGDLWVLPFLNVYGLVGYVHNESTTSARVTLDTPGPGPGADYRTEVETSLDGVVGGLGTTLAAGYLNFFSVIDFCYIRSDLGFDDDFTARITSFRVGYNGVLAEMPMQLWLGAGDWDTAATAKGHTTLPNGARLDFEADQQPVDNWMYDIGGNFQFSPHWLLVVDAGADFNGGWYAVLGPTYRFGS